MDMSLDAFQNRTFLVPGDYIEKLPIYNKDNVFQYFENPFIEGTQVMFDYEIELGGQGKLEVWKFVTESESINHYLLIYKLNNGKFLWSAQRSMTELPRIWDRHFNFGPDYIDFLHIQNVANWILDGLGLKKFEINRDKKDKSVFIIHDGKNLAIKAEAVEIKEAKQ